MGNSCNLFYSDQVLKKESEKSVTVNKYDQSSGSESISGGDLDLLDFVSDAMESYGFCNFSSDKITNRGPNRYAL